MGRTIWKGGVVASLVLGVAWAFESTSSPKSEARGSEIRQVANARSSLSAMNSSSNCIDFEGLRPDLTRLYRLQSLPVGALVARQLVLEIRDRGASSGTAWFAKSLLSQDSSTSCELPSSVAEHSVKKDLFSVQVPVLWDSEQPEQIRYWSLHAVPAEGKLKLWTHPSRLTPQNLRKPASTLELFASGYRWYQEDHRRIWLAVDSDSIGAQTTWVEFDLVSSLPVQANQLATVARLGSPGVVFANSTKR